MSFPVGRDDYLARRSREIRESAILRDVVSELQVGRKKIVLTLNKGDSASWIDLSVWSPGDGHAGPLKERGRVNMRGAEIDELVVRLQAAGERLAATTKGRGEP